MGGFVLVTKAPGTDHRAAQAAAARVFVEMGFAPPEVIEDDTYVLLMYPKRQTKKLTLRNVSDRNFVFCCGTLIYDGDMGTPAALAFYRDHDNGSRPRERAMGHYTIILRRHGQTEIIPDTFGGYHVFYDARRYIVSSSFLAVASAVGQVTLGAQSAYEYVFNGAVSGNRTLFDEVRLAPVNGTFRVDSHTVQVLRHSIQLSITPTTASFEATIAESMELLDRYFAPVVRRFGNRLTCALSGGYDSRFLLALLRRHGATPRLYVYGSAADKDVDIALTIAKSEGFVLDVIDKSKLFYVAPGEFAEVVRANFFAVDGYSWEGIFDNGAERSLRAQRVDGNVLVLNGGGGEIWRNFFYLLDRSYSPRELLWSFYSRFDPATCTEAFDEEAYFRQLENKLFELVGDRRQSIPRPLVEWLYHNFRCRAWDGRANTVNASYGYTALPFLERPITEHASAIPTSWKNHGAYEAELLRRTDSRLAAYPSVYGHDFSRNPPLKRRFLDYGTYLRPPWLRRFSYRLRHRLRHHGESSQYLRREYQDAVLPKGVQLVNALFRLDQVADPEQMARILSLEYLAREFEDCIRVRFDISPPNGDAALYSACILRRPAL